MWNMHLWKSPSPKGLNNVSFSTTIMSDIMFVDYIFDDLALLPTEPDVNFNF